MRRTYRRCVDCGEPMSFGNEQPPGVKRQTTSKHARGRCIDCAVAVTSVYGVRPHIEHRYCTCTVSIARTPELRDQCADCFRRIDPRFDAVPGDVIHLLPPPRSVA